MINLALTPKVGQNVIGVNLGLIQKVGHLIEVGEGVERKRWDQGVPTRYEDWVTRDEGGLSTCITTSAGLQIPTRYTQEDEIPSLPQTVEEPRRWEFFIQ